MMRLPIPHFILPLDDDKEDDDVDEDGNANPHQLLLSDGRGHWSDERRTQNGVCVISRKTTLALIHADYRRGEMITDVLVSHQLDDG